MSLAVRLRWPVTRQDPAADINQWASYFTYLGLGYGTSVAPSMLYGDKKQETPDTYAGVVQLLYRQNTVVFACMSVRALLFSEARFQFRQIRGGRPGEMFGTQELELLEVPWPNGTTGDLLSRAIQSVDLAGNFYAYRDGDQLRVLRPDWVSIVLGSQSDAEKPADAYDAEVIGYLYHPGGFRSGQEPKSMLPGQVAHWAQYPDPLARFRGMSWITPVLREVLADNAATDHKTKFFENGATPNIVLKTPEANPANFRKWVDMFKTDHEGVANAYKTLFLGGGADVSVVGANMRQMDFKSTQGAGETRIAAAAGTPPIIVGLSEGLQAATYSNYALAMRRFTDLTMRPLWRNFAASIAPLVNVPPGSELWYDDRDIPALAEDANQIAQNQQQQSSTMHTLIAAGFEPETVVNAVLANDLSQLQHSGMYSVQLQPAGAVTEGKGAVVSGVVAPEKAQTNGSTGGAEAVPTGS